MNIFQDKNNNAKRSLRDLQMDSIQNGEDTSTLHVTEFFSDAKRKKVFETSTPIANKKVPKVGSIQIGQSTSTTRVTPVMPITNDAKKKKVSKDDGFESDTPPSSTSSDDVVIVLDSSNDTSSGVLVDSSVTSTSTQTEYGFDALQTDDETDVDEDVDRHPYWSLYRNRFPIVKDQTIVNSNVIDKFFGCKHETVDSRTIFPLSVNIPRRRSTANWNTPPRYSTLPKY